MSARSSRHHQIPTTPAKTDTDSDIRHQFHSHGMPQKPAELTWRDYLIMLLHIGAELEQSLMVQYLYSAYSLGGDHAREREQQVKEWRDAIIGVAKEEMGHLLTVQNVLCLLGGPISFEREDYPWDTPYYPFKFALEPLSQLSLAKYVYAEMPGDVGKNPVDIQVVADVHTLLNKDPGHPVGEIYDLILEIISDPEKIPDSDFNADSYGIQASFDDWGRGYRQAPLPPHAKSKDAKSRPDAQGTRLIIAQMATRTEAIAALRDVAGQGESLHGPKDPGEPSHFDRFAKVFSELKGIQDDDKNWDPARMVPTNPAITDPTKSIEDQTCIKAEPSRTWASLFNVRYRMLLTYLSHTFSLQRENDDALDPLRPAIMSKVFGEMYNLKAIAGILVRLPLNADPNDPHRAGPTFQMPYTLTLPSSEVDIWRQHLDLVRASQELTRELLHKKKNNLKHAPPDGKKYLLALADLDDLSEKYINHVLVGLRPIRRSAK